MLRSRRPPTPRRQCSREDDALALRLLFEKHELGALSPWAPHLAVLPPAYPTVPCTWDPAERAELQGSGVLEKVRECASVHVCECDRAGRWVGGW